MAIERITGIVTDIVRYNDRHNIVGLYTRERGRISFLVPATGGKGGRARNARLQLLSAVESDVNFKENKSIQSLSKVGLKEVWRDIYFNPLKSALAIFIAEFLSRYLREAAPEPLLWDYILESLRILDNRKKHCANFHISFLIGMLHFAGITPDISDIEPGDFFDMPSGHCVPEHPSHRSFLSPEETRVLPVLIRMNYTNDRLFKFRGEERRRILNRILQYYAVHFPGMSSLRSPEILGEVFA
ncbi:MAG: DNA repair protein RecO C-terminal domain-containing protein [Muribaculaceae bacterium]|nr:DNA repair protein RecO C-terminal domain-containing protein [Muribaculaceae bacterium]